MDTFNCRIIIKITDSFRHLWILCFFFLKKSLEEKIEELALRVGEEEAVLNELNNENSPFKEQVIDIRNRWRSNILGLNIFRNINNIDNTVNINNNINNERNNLIN